MYRQFVFIRSACSSLLASQASQDKMYRKVANAALVGGKLAGVGGAGVGSKHQRKVRKDGSAKKTLRVVAVASAAVSVLLLVAWLWGSFSPAAPAPLDANLGAVASLDDEPAPAAQKVEAAREPTIAGHSIHEQAGTARGHGQGERRRRPEEQEEYLSLQEEKDDFKGPWLVSGYCHVKSDVKGVRKGSGS